MASAYTTLHQRQTVGEAEPAWEIATLFPPQGSWSVEEFLALDTGNRLVEFTNGWIEVLPMPTTSHQRVSAFLFGLFQAFVSSRKLGEVLYAPLLVQLGPGKFREPDLVFMQTAHRDRIGDDFWNGADLVLEVVSANDPDRDLKIKRLEYARAGIPEYWIVDPRKSRIVVLKLAGKTYRVHGEFQPGQAATSHLLPDFSVDVAAVFAAAK